MWKTGALNVLWQSQCSQVVHHADSALHDAEWISVPAWHDPALASATYPYTWHLAVALLFIDDSWVGAPCMKTSRLDKQACSAACRQLSRPL